MSKLKPLNAEEHQQAAAMVIQAQELLSALARVASNAKGARYVDQVLRVQRTVQEKLIDPLREDHLRDIGGPDPYPSVGYIAGPTRL